MSSTRDILAERLTELVESDTRSPRAISIDATGQPDTIRDVLRRKSLPNADILDRLAETLGTTTDYLLGRAEAKAQVRSEVSFREVPQDWAAPEHQGIPVLGTGYCDDLVIEGEDGEVDKIERILLEIDHTVSMVRRPAALWNAQDAYAIYYHGSSMEPRFYQGELGIVDPRRPPSPGDFVVVQMNDGESDDVQTVLVKQLVRLAGGYYQLRQFNPDLTFRIARTRVSRIHRICSANELYGA